MRWKLNRTIEPCAHEPLWSFSWNVYIVCIQRKPILLYPCSNVCLERAHNMVLVSFARERLLQWNKQKDSNNNINRNVHRQQYHAISPSVAVESRFYREIRNFFFIKCKLCIVGFHLFAKVLAYTFIPVLLFHLSFAKDVVFLPFF